MEATAAMILQLVMKLLRARIDAELARQTAVGGEIHIVGLARGLKLAGHKWQLDCTLRRTE